MFLVWGCALKIIGLVIVRLESLRKQKYGSFVKLGSDSSSAPDYTIVAKFTHLPPSTSIFPSKNQGPYFLVHRVVGMQLHVIGLAHICTILY